MATREELLLALERADEQGNITDAEMIARMIDDGKYDDVPSLDESFGEPEEVGFFEQEGGQLIGGIALGIKGAQMGAPYGPWGVVGGGAVGSFIGGTVGDLTQQGYQVVTDSPLSPKNIEESLTRAFKSGGEEGMYDLAGSIFFKGAKPLWDVTGGKLWSLVRPKPIKGIEQFAKTIEEHGGSLTASQMTNNRLVDTVEGLAGSTWGGSKIIKDARTINDQAITNYTSSYINSFNRNTKEILSDEGIGTLFLNGLEAGRTIHSKMGGEMYVQLDELYKPLMRTKTVVQETPTGILDQAGKMLSRKVTQEVTTEVLPVSTKALKDFARKELNKSSGTKQKSLGNWSKKELNDILKFDDTISFAEAQAYRSKLLSEARNAQKPQALGEGMSSGMISALAKKADAIIEQGALATKNPEFIASWRNANTFWKEGKEVFANKFMSKLAEKNGSAVGKHLFNSAPEDIRKAHLALKKAASLSKGTADEFSFAQTWLDVQQGYVQKLIADTVSTAPGKVGEISVDKLGKWFVKGTDKGKKLESIFTKEQRQGISTFMKSVQAMQKKPVGEGSFMVTVGQAGLVLNALGGFGQTSQDFAGFTGDVAVFTITPYALAKMLTRPKLAKSIAGVVRMSNKKNLGRAAWAAIAKVIGTANEYNNTGEE